MNEGLFYKGSVLVVIQNYYSVNNVSVKAPAERELLEAFCLRTLTKTIIGNITVDMTFAVTS